MSTQIVKFWFWFLWSIDAVIAAVALYFFFSLAADDRIRSFNILPWLLILVGQALYVAGDFYTYTYPALLGGTVGFPKANDDLRWVSLAMLFTSCEPSSSLASRRSEFL